MDGERIILRRYAAAKSLKWYFTGKACANGHVSKRRTSTSSCCECESIRWLRPRKYVYSAKKAAASSERYHRDVEKSRARQRGTAEKLRRRHGQLTMAEYRARIHEASLVSKAKGAEERASTRVIREAARKAEVAARREAVETRQREKQRIYREANRDKCLALQKAWRENNREKRLADKRARKCCKRITLTRDLSRLQRGRCAYCRVRLGDEFHVDHVMPLKRGGPDHRSNLQLTCQPCNQTKHAKDPIDFARSTGRLI